ncbi:hypothetical protein PM082_004451 [Marasmius tenuissimus]|nr:hypothetical protein PM082_004451 [Marasmius tenuissimus]
MPSSFSQLSRAASLSLPSYTPPTKFGSSEWAFIPDCHELQWSFEGSLDCLLWPYQGHVSLMSVNMRGFGLPRRPLPEMEVENERRSVRLARLLMDLVDLQMIHRTKQHELRSTTDEVSRV